MTSTATRMTEPIRVLNVELGHGASDLAALDAGTSQGYRRAMALVRLHSLPLGIVEVELPSDGLPASAVGRAIWSALGDRIRDHVRRDRRDDTEWPACLEPRRRALAAAPRASVVVATRNRTHLLDQCLRSLLALEYPNFEVIVVDNAPGDESSANLIRNVYATSGRVRYLREPQPGLALARNRGIAAADGEIVAITDDDVLADRHWLAEIVAGFDRARNVACVTGMIFPRQLDTDAQVLTERYWGLGKGFDAQIFDMAAHRPSSALYPYAAGVFGSGANLAFRTSVVRGLGGFDPALGAGSRARGGEDLAIFRRVVASGYRLVYQPSALVNHLHCRTLDSLRRQAFGYGAGMTAYLTECMIDEPAGWLGLLRRVPRGLVYALSPRSEKNRRKPCSYPRELTRAELLGMLSGPVLYLRSRWERRSHTAGCAAMPGWAASA